MKDILGMIIVWGVPLSAAFICAMLGSAELGFFLAVGLFILLNALDYYRLTQGEGK